MASKGYSEGYAEEYKKNRENAMADLIEQAEALQGDAIVNLSVAYDQFVNADMLCVVVTAYGTVVALQEKQMIWMRFHKWYIIKQRKAGNNYERICISGPGDHRSGTEKRPDH